MNKNIYKFLKVLGLFILMSILPYIPIIMLNLNIDNFSNLGKSLYLFGMDIIFLFIIIYSYHKDIYKNLKEFYKNFINNLEYGFKYWLIGFLVMIISNWIIINFTGGIASNEETVRNQLQSFPIYMMFTIVFYAPLTEELIFRKGIREFINNKYIYILVSGLIFGSLHVLPSIENPIELLHLIPYCSLGVAFASLYYKTNNIFSSIMMHLFHNTLALMVIIFFGGGV